MKTAVMVVLAGLGMATASFGQEDVGALRKRISELEAENAQLRQTVQEQASRLAELDNKVQQVTTQATAAREELSQTQQKLADAQSKTVELEKQKSEAISQHQAVFVQRQTDAASGQTVLSTYAMEVKMLHGARKGHWVNLSATFAGATAQSGKVTLGLQTQYSGSIYQGVKEMTITADGRTIRSVVVDYERTRRIVGNSKARTDRSDEMVQLELSLEDVVAISQASSVTCRLGHAEFEFPRRVIQGFGAFASAMRTGQ